MVGNTYENVWIENVTGSGISISDLGIPNLPPGVAFDVSTQFHDEDLRFSNDLRSLVEQDYLTVSGAIFTGNSLTTATPELIELTKEQVLLWLGGVQLGAANLYLKKDSFGPTATVVDLYDNVKTVTVSGSFGTTTLSGENVTFSGVGGITLFGHEDTNVVTVSGESTGIGSLPGKTYQISYGNSGVTTNKWLEVGHGNPSNQSPHVIPFSSQLIAVTFSNKNDGVDCDVEIYIAPEGGGVSPKYNVLTWALRDVRLGRRTDVVASGIEFDPGDKIAIYVRDKGDSPQDTVVNVYLQIDVANEEAPITENFPEYFVI